MNEWAMITGASAGIGLEFARVFAANRFNLVLVARNEDRLNKIAEELRATNGDRDQRHRALSGADAHGIF